MCKKATDAWSGEKRLNEKWRDNGDNIFDRSKYQ
jgi:hypothetical protein